MHEGCQRIGESAGNNRLASIPRTANQPGKSSVRDIQVWPLKLTITARWYSDKTNQSVTISMIALCLSGILKAYLLPTIGLESEFLLEPDPDGKTHQNNSNSTQIQPKFSNLNFVYQPGKSSVRDLQARLSRTTHLSSGHNVALTQISPGTGNSVCSKFLPHWSRPTQQDLPGAQIQKLKRAEELSGLTCENIRATLLLRIPLQRRLRPPNWYQSKEQLKTSSSPPVSLQTTAEINGNLPKKGSNEQ
ncbi:Ribulose-1,5 bisphosphate carboxylase/oxygenase large subunit N-methyltransferase isoform 1 [Dorcoceras hygrometricum]|uniref:Ribulose-1,5 bisphosphate carboxylase/oxygenase large subunit N-methyltransferase isoform 1 n=1 Tax=Dorcoceras hygrometricum TaxID=472368 RepID=A0A2Z7A9V0_9LAMI|nr:Ribulose-1,5 bisphosphate carboxylase/oxygenase large subunit N-methyltransferase isoform 1 [Dorcoceras hygrometricum]